MPDTKTAPAPEAEAEDTELGEIEQSVRAFDEAGMRKLYAERGFSDAEADMLIAPMKAQNETNRRLLQREQRTKAATYQTGLREQFPYAFDAEGKPLFSGTTNAEMRRAAQRLHDHTAAIVGTAAKASPKSAPTEDESARAEAWGAPPQGATEISREIPDATWETLRSDAVHKPAIRGEDTKRDIIRNIKDNGPRVMRRQSLANISSRQSQTAARAAAKA